MERLAAKVPQGIVSPRTANNRCTALRKFLQIHNLNADDPIGAELRGKFDEYRRAFAEHLLTSGSSPRNLSNTLSCLRPWRAMLVAIDTERAVAGDDLRPFNQALTDLLKGHSADRLRRTLSIPRAMIYGWLEGKRPRLSNCKHIYKLEAHFGLERDALTRLAGFERGTYVAPCSIGEPPIISYRDRLGACCKEAYFVKPSPGSALRTQWRDYLVYKTADEPDLLRTSKGVWRFSPLVFNIETPARWPEYLDGVEVPSAKMTWAKFAAYLGWLAIPATDGGGGIPPADTETLAWLAVSDKVEAYVRWLIKRVNGKYNGSVAEFIAKARSVLRPEYGYLYQLPDFMHGLPENVRTQGWEDMCKSTFRMLSAKEKRLRKTRTKTRDPRAPMSHLLDLEKPLDPVADMLQRMRADRPIGDAPVVEAAWGRDIALIKLLVSNPLRLRNISTLTWREDNTGQLYQRGDRSWWIRVESANFKNVQGAAGDREYDMPAQEMVWADLERYLRKQRPLLLRCATDYVFLASRHGAFPRDPALPWAGLSRRVTEITRRYLWRCGGVGVHAFRHLVATALIKASGLSDFGTAALVLNDRIATVEKNYAHLRSADGANRMRDLLGDSLKKM